MSMIIITHDMGVVAEAADDIAVMYAGQFVEQASAEELFDHPEHPYTEALLGALPQLEGEGVREGRLTAIPGRPPDLLNPPPACRFAPRCPYAEPGDSCAVEPPQLREIRPGHLVRSAHPASERTAAPVGAPRDERRAAPGLRPEEVVPRTPGLPHRADGRLREGGRRRLVRDRRGGDARPRGRVRLGEVDDGLLRAAASECRPAGRCASWAGS